MKETFLDYFKIPKVKSSEEYQVDKEDIKYEYDVVKRDNYYYLFEKGDNPEPFDWVIYDLSNKIRKKYGEIIYGIVEKNREDGSINILIGNSFEPYFELYHAKYTINEDNRKNSIERLNYLLNINSDLFNCNEIVIFNINCNEDEIYKIFKDKNIKIESKNRLKKFLSSLPIREIGSKKIVPVFWALGILIIIYGIGNYLVNDYNKSVAMKMDSIKKEWVYKIDNEDKRILQLKKEIEKHRAIESMKDKDIYKGIK